MLTSFLSMLNIFSFLTDPFLTTKQKLFRIFAPILILILLIGFFNFFVFESFIGTDMWFRNSMSDSKLNSKQERTDNLVKISKGYLPGERPSSGGLLENFENINTNYNPRNYEIQADYHRTVQQFGVDPNPIDSLETPEFMIPKTYRTKDKYENLMEVTDNIADSMRLRDIETTFTNVEKNKYYKDLLMSKCRSGNRSNHKNCNCNSPKYGEY